MKQHYYSFIVLLFISLTAFTPSVAQKYAADDILGTWFVQEKDAKVEIYKCGSKYCGKIVWLQRPNDEKGNPRTDIHNPDSGKRNNPIMGLQVVKDLSFDAPSQEWSGGTVYDSRKGKAYSGYMTLKDKNTLYMTGYIMGMRWLSRTNTWTRAN